MRQQGISHLIINSPYAEPAKHWHYERKTRSFVEREGRRPAGYLVLSSGSRAFDDPGEFVDIPLVNQIRKRVQAWRESGYPGVTGITKRLLGYWTDAEDFETRRFFFCQLEAMETLIWLREAPAAERVGIDIPSDGGEFVRQCAKMATGTGKTVVMAMAAAWHILNKIAYPKDIRFSKNILVVAPGLTVRSRLAVLNPTHPENYYETFRIVPSGLLDKLRQGKVLITNWHALNWENDDQIARKRSVDKRGALSDVAYVRKILGDMASARNILVFNDEAHHAWRIPSQDDIKGIARSEVEAATKWIGGLDRIHRARKVLVCYDFSATPCVPSGKKTTEETLFKWIVSDFGLNDAIEAGLVKTPRVVVHDDALPDARYYKSRLYHIYNDPEVKSDLNRKAAPEEPLPDLVINGYYLLGYDWRETAKRWKTMRFKTPPVMISVANRTETAARIQHSFASKRILIDELCDEERILHIDSKVMNKAETSEEGTSASRRKAEALREKVNTIGQSGRLGEAIQNVISVGMLSEGWDAKTVTHIMGLRAFTSQLLCEQVVGRGLRRTAYDLNPETQLMDPEYVNVFGIPFTFLPHEANEGSSKPPLPQTAIEPLKEKLSLAVSWPNILRIEHTYRSRLCLDWSKVQPLMLDANQISQLIRVAPVVDGKPNILDVATIDLEKLAEEHRTQKIIFETARMVYGQMQADWKGSQINLIGQIILLVEEFMQSDRIAITPPLYGEDPLRKRLILTLNMTNVVRHIWEAIYFENASRLEPVFDTARPILSTGDMMKWYTGKPCTSAHRSHISYCVCDSTWEQKAADDLDRSPHVEAWVKNDHLGFEIFYFYRGAVRKYRPDFLVRLQKGNMLVLEMKGVDDERNRTKRRFLKEWIDAVNQHGGFGTWRADVCFEAGGVTDIVKRHAQEI